MSLPRRKIWGRRQSRPLKDKQKDLVVDLLPQVQITLEENGAIVPSQLFPQATTAWLEIGFGGGEHLAEQAARHPNVGIIGCEPFMNGVASLLGHMAEMKLENVRIVQDDARLVLEQLPAKSISRVFILFADPWPKKRHHKRRIIQVDSLARIAEVLTSDGLLHLATDDPGYQEWIVDVLAHSPQFVAVDDGRVVPSERPSDWPQTRYEQKALAAGRCPHYWVLKKISQ